MSLPDLSRPRPDGAGFAATEGPDLRLPLGWQARGDVHLLLHRSGTQQGGIFSVGLRLEGAGDIDFHAARVRIAGRPVIDAPVAATDWVRAQLLGERLTVAGWVLTAHEALLLARGLDPTADDTGLLHVETQLAFLGQRAALPARVRLDVGALAARLSEVHGDEPKRDAAVRRDLVNHLAAQHAIDALPLRMKGPQTPQAVRAVTQEVAERIMAAAFEPTDRVDASAIRYRLRPLKAWTDWAAGLTPGEQIWLDLSRPAIGRAWWSARWSLADHWATLTEAERRASRIEVDAPQPLQPFPIHITNTVPVDGTAAHRVSAKVRRVGPRLVPAEDDLEFGPARSTATVWGIQQLGQAARYDYQIRLQPGRRATGWPAPITRAEAGVTTPHLHITPARFGLQSVRIGAHRKVFAHCAAIEMQWRTTDGAVRTERLTAAEPARRLLLPIRAEREATITAIDEAGQVRPLGQQQLLREIFVEPGQLSGVHHTLWLTWPQTASAGAEVWVQLRPRWQPSTPRSWLLRPMDPAVPIRLQAPSIFTPIELDWRAEWLWRSPAGWAIEPVAWSTTGWEARLRTPT